MLNVRSCYDFGNSTIKIENLVKKAKETGYDYVSICDPNFFALPSLISFCSLYGLKPVFGLRVEINSEEFSFFPKNKTGLNQIIKYYNGLSDISDLFSSKELITIILKCHPEKSHVYDESVFYGCTDFASFENPCFEKKVFFFPVSIMSNSEIPALKVLKKIIKKEEVSAESHFQSLLSIKDMLKEFPKNTNEIAAEEEITKQIDFYDLKSDFKIPLPPNLQIEDENLFLKELCLNGLKEKGISDNQKYVERLETELEIIYRKSFTRYILLAKHIVDCAKKINATVGPGRGSSVSSMVCFLCGITLVDPLKEGLIFERFINEEREEPPDIDIDIEDTLRQDLISSLRESFGSEHVAQIVTFGTYGRKMAERDMAKASGNSEVIRILEGLPRHISIHAAGIIFSETDLREIIPLSQENNNFVTQYDMAGIQKSGIVKMDILGLSTLGVLKKSDADFTSSEYNDKETFESFRPDNLAGIFQLDSMNGHKLTSVFKPENLEDLRILISINRPGPGQSGLSDELILRKRGLKIVEYEHPTLEKILSETYGVPVYQEQIMQMAMELGGFSAKEADTLRKAMSKKIPELMIKQKEKFLEGCTEKGVEIKTAAKLYSEMEEFSGYAFNKAHASSYSILTYLTANSKTRSPAKFYSILLDQNNGNTKKMFEICQEALSNSIEIIPPDLKRSEVQCSSDDNKIFLGLIMIKEIGEQLAEKIIAFRNQNEFSNLESLFDSIPEKLLGNRQVEQFFYAGALKSFGSGWSLNQILEQRDRNKQQLKLIGSKLFGDKVVKQENKNDKSGFSLSTIAEDRIKGLGFLVDYEEVFSIRYSPFSSLSNLFLGVITEVITLGSRYICFDGLNSELLYFSDYGLKSGDFVIISKKNSKRNQHREFAISLLGRYFPDRKEIVFSDQHFNLVFGDIEKSSNRIKKSGIKVLKVTVQKKNLEVEF